MEIHSRFRDALFVVAAFSASRVALEAVGLLAFYKFRPHISFAHAWNYSDLPWLSIWGVWDTGWYLEVAQQGYDLARRTATATPNQANWAFFPAYPMLCRGLAQLLGLPIFSVMVVVSNACFLGALFVVRYGTEAVFGSAAARYTVVLLCFIPGSYVFSSAYPEAMFLLLMASTLVLVDRRRWLAAGCVAALATLTRNTGIALVLYMVVSHLRVSLAVPMGAVPVGAVPVGNKNSETLVTRLIPGWGEAWRILCALALPVAALLGFCLYLFIHVGDPIAFVTVQDGWLRHYIFPLLPLLMPWNESGFWHNPLNYAAALAAFLLLIPLAVWRRWDLFALGAFFVFFPMTSGIESYVRYSICMLPLVMAAGALLARHPTGAVIVLPVLALLDGLMMAGWALGLTITF
jgi:hypothetical protein